MYKRKDGRPGSLEISQAVRKTAPGWRNRYSITVPIGRPIIMQHAKSARARGGWRNRHSITYTAIGRPIGSTQKAPGRRVVWRNRNSAVLLIGRAIGNTEKRGPAEAQTEKNAIVLPIGRAIGNTEKRPPAASHPGEIAMVLPIRRAIGNTEKEWLGRRAVLRNRHVIT